VRYFIKEGCRSFFVNWTMSLACVTIVTACLVVFGIFLSLSMNVSQITNYTRSEYEIRVIISPETTERRVKEIGREIEVIENVANCTLVTRAERFSELPENVIAGLDLSDNPLSDSFVVTFKNLEMAAQTADEISEIPEVRQTTQSKETLDKVNTLFNKVTAGVIALIAIMILISVFIISNTIKLTVFARKRDINIMKFVGATDWFIRWPFIIEGMVIGVIGAAFAFLAVWYGYGYVAAGIGAVFTNFNVFAALVSAEAIMPILISSFLGFGILIGAVGSIISVRRHLHV
jgi:cell division transport system permease protein